MSYELHPLCTLFPRVVGAEFDALVSDIRAHGLRNPIVLHDGMVLDGGNRYRACIEAGIEPVFAEFDGGSVVAFVLSSNLHRRHLTPGQQAAIVASAQDWAQAQGRGGDRKSDQSATLHFDSVAKRSAESGASLRTQKMADKVAKASPDLARKVAHGEVSLPKALAQVENKPAKGAEPEPWSDEGAPSIDELMLTEKAAEQELEAMQRIFGADDKLAEALQMVKQRDALIEQLQWRVNGLVNENAELIRTVKSLRRRVEKDAA